MTQDRPTPADPGTGAAVGPAADASSRQGEGAATGISLQGTAIVGVGMVTSQVIAMLQMLVVSRLLGPEQFGAFGALAVVLLLGSTTMAATQVVIARHVASGRTDRHVGAGPILLVGLITLGITALLTPLLTTTLNLSTPIGLLLVGATFVPFAVTGAQLGLLQGAERHARLGTLYVIATAARVLGAILGAAIGGSAVASVAGLAVGAAVGAVAGQFLLPGMPTWGAREEGARDFVAEVLHAAHALLALYALTNVDVLIARSQLDPHDAGLYAAGALIARAVFFLPQAVLIAAFPRMVAGARGAQRQTLLAVAALGVASTVVVALVPGLIVRIMSGPQYSAVASEAWIFALAGAGFALVQVLLYARMAQHDRRSAILLWGGAVALVIVGVTLGTSVHALIVCTATVAWSVAAGGLLWARQSSPARTGSDQPIVTPPA